MNAATGRDDTSQPPPIDLRAVLTQLGVPTEQIDEAAASGTLELFALERIADGMGPRYDVDEVAAAAGIAPEWILALWRALGFPEPRSGEKVFSDDDLVMLTDTVPFIAEGGLESGVALQMTRVIGSSVARIASAQVDAIASEIEHRRSEHDDPDQHDDVDQEVAERAATLLPMMPKVMEFVWRRHLAHAARRRLLRAEHGIDSVCIGFADLVGFTAQTQQLEAHELASVVERFERIAHDLVASNGGRVVKMIGDEVMFCTESVDQGAQIALAMASTYGEDAAFSDVRVGLASGQVLERDGDVYGPVVNLASRIVSVAYPGAVVVSEQVADALGSDDALLVKSIRSHYLKDIGKVSLYTLRRSDTDDLDGRYVPERRRRAARRQFLLETRVRRSADVAERSAQVRGMLPDELLEQSRYADEPTEQIEAINTAVLEADIDDQLAEEILADIDATRRLGQLERDAAAKADEADSEAERKIIEAEREARRRVLEAEAEARRKIEAALAEAEEKAERANEEASRKVRRVAKEAERRAQQAERQAARTAKQRTRKRRDERSRQAKHDATGDAERERDEDGRGS